MNKISLFFALLIGISVSAQMQMFPNYGSISEVEKQLKECAFDKESEAVYLLHEGVAYYNEDYNLITDHHVRLKILREKGIEYANVIIPFNSDHDFESISGIEGVVINFDEQGDRSEQKLDRKSIFTKKTTKYHSEVRFAFPSVKAGSIIEYIYRSTMKHYGGLDEWTFQEELPVVKSSYSLTIIPNYEFAYLFKKSKALPAEVKNDPKSGQIHFAMSNIPGLRNEPYMDARKDYLQRVTFQLTAYQGSTGHGYSLSRSSVDKTTYSSTWEQVIKELTLEKSFGGQLSKNLDDTEDFVRQVKAKSSDTEKMKLVFDYVRKSITWNHIISTHSPEGVKSAWNKKTGTNGEVNLILVNLLRAAGLEAHPLLVSERQNGKVNKDFPSDDQFNTVYAFVVADGKKYYLNGNDKVTPPGMIPEEILNTMALMVDRKSGGIISISNEELQFRESVNISAKLSEDGKIAGNAYLSSQDYARVNRLAEYWQNKETYMDEKFIKNIQGIRIDSFILENENNDSLALKQQFSFQFPVQQTGAYLFLPVNLFSGFEKNPFVAANRFSQINFGYKQSFSLKLIIHLPPTLAADDLPKPIKLVNDDQTIECTRQILKDDAKNALVATINIELKKSMYTADEYYAIKEFYKKMFALLDEQVVLKRKS